MKHAFLILVLASLVISCDDSKQYEGKWRLDPLRLKNNELDYPFSIYVENDSIKFNYWYFEHWHKFPLKIKSKKLLFNSWEIPANKLEDTIYVNKIAYVKDEKDSVFKWWWDDPLIKIELPKTNSKYFKFDKINSTAPNSYLHYGKRLDNNAFSLQLNGNHSKLTDLPEFLHIGHHYTYHEEQSPFPSSILFIDQSTGMKDLESILFEHKRVNRLKISFINNISISYQDSLGLYYDYELLNKRLPPFNENDTYRPGHLANIPPPPPPPPYFTFFGDQKPELQFVLLKNGTLFHDNNPISTSELKTLANSWVKKKNAIFSLYDLESTFGKFLEMTAIINSAYQNERNTLSKRKFNKPLSDLNRDEMTSLKLEIPLYHVWSYSIPHYNHVVQQKNNTFGVNLSVIH
ncbi:hypothetical protein [Hyunsoonleella rubra]|uniref:Uncharacterized protein n=1 Tax=Hyunsoonleella rubra TaxID=1737062 RepID=A0ABW5TCF7_9FLAO